MISIPNMIFYDYLRLVVVIAGFGTLIFSLENIRCLEVVSKNGILSWDILQYQDPMSDYKFFDYIYSPKGLIAVYVFQALLAVASLILAIFHIYSFFIFFPLLILYSIPVLRSSYGLDGALQMYVILYFSLSIIIVSPSNTFVPEVGMIFIGIQAMISYSISGIAKLISPEWRNGSALEGIFGTKIYGNEIIFQYFKDHSDIRLMTSWFIMLFESLFIFSVFIDTTTILVFLLLGFFFHLFNMLFMGLNNFFFAFLATYPSIFYIHHLV